MDSPFLDAPQQDPSSAQSPFLDNSQASQTTSGTSSAFSDIEPQDVINAQEYMGNTDYEGLCEAFAEKMTNSPNMGATAYDAWNNWQQQGKANTDMSQITPGSLVYFNADGTNGGDGHVVIYTGNGNIVSPDYSGVHLHSLQNWIQTTKQQPLGFVTP